MPRYRFFALLSNTRGPWHRIQLPSDLRVERWTRARIVKLWRRLSELPDHELYIQLDAAQVLPDDAKSGHVVVGQLEAPGTATEADWRSTHELFDRAIENLHQRCRLLSFYLIADVQPVVCYWYPEGAEDGELEMSVGAAEPRERLPGWLHPYEVEQVNQFTDSTTLPLSLEYVQLALEHWEESLRDAKPAFQLLSLVTALEALFNVGAQDIRYRTARSIAVLLGRDSTDSDELFETTLHAYDVRSKLVHTGQYKGLQKLSLHQLRRHVRNAILRCHTLGLKKDELAKRLTRLGFGCGGEV
jgi:hypothetical protein